MLTDRSEGSRREITGVVTLDDAKEALALLTQMGVPGDTEIHGYLHVGWTGGPADEEGNPDPEGRPTSLALWVEADVADA